MAVKIHGLDGRVRDVTIRRRLPTPTPTLVTGSVRQSATGEAVNRLKNALDRSDAATRSYRKEKNAKG